MIPEKFQYYTSLTIKDDNGLYGIEVQNDCSQIRIDPNNGGFDISINTDRSELIILRDMLTKNIKYN